MVVVCLLGCMGFMFRGRDDLQGAGHQASPCGQMLSLQVSQDIGTGKADWEVRTRGRKMWQRVVDEPSLLEHARISQHMIELVPFWPS